MRVTDVGMGDYDDGFGNEYGSWGIEWLSRTMLLGIDSPIWYAPRVTVQVPLGFDASSGGGAGYHGVNDMTMSNWGFTGGSSSGESIQVGGGNGSGTSATVGNTPPLTVSNTPYYQAGEGFSIPMTPNEEALIRSLAFQTKIGRELWTRIGKLKAERGFIVKMTTWTLPFHAMFSHDVDGAVNCRGTDVTAKWSMQSYNLTPDLIVHELSHVLHQLLGTMPQGHVPGTPGLPWAEVLAMDYQNQARKELGLEPQDKYFLPLGGVRGYLITVHGK